MHSLPGSKRYPELLEASGSNRELLRKELACAVLLIVTTPLPAVLWCFLCPCHELLSVILPNPVAGQQNVAHYILNKVLLERSPAHLFSYRLWLLPCHNGRVVATGTGWPQKLKYFLSGPLQKMFVNPRSRVDDIRRPVYRREEKGSQRACLFEVERASIKVLFY